SDTRIDVCRGGHSPEERRAFADILAHIGDKWTVLVVGVLAHGPMRYSQIFKLVEGISQRMLTLTLKSLERDGLVTRTVYPTNPPRVDYELTERGKTLIVPLHMLWTWAQANRTAIEGARRHFDQQRSKDGCTDRLNAHPKRGHRFGISRLELTRVVAGGAARRSKRRTGAANEERR